MTANYQVLMGDCYDRLLEIPDNSIQCCVTSPPYFGLCDYEVEGQYGLEESLSDYLKQMTLVFSEVRRVLTEGGCCWIVIGDSSNNYSAIRAKGQRRASTISKRRKIQPEQREKSILNVPVKLGIALEADGWIYRNNLIWDKGTCGTIAKSDTASQAHETILQMGKFSANGRPYLNCKSINSSVLRFPPTSDETHPCPYPLELATELIEYSSEPGDTVLDPFMGTGSTLLAANQIGRNSIGIELNPKFAEIAEQRLSRTQLSLFGVVA